MKKVFVILIGALLLFVGVALASPSDRYSEERVTGHSSGNHALDCTVIRPWRSSSSPGDRQYPVIVWANGWGGNDVAGESTTEWYKPILVEWVLDGPYIVIAAN
jgi:hypothetical protein